MTIISKIFKKNEFIITYQVDDKSDGLRIDQYILKRHSNFSRQEIKKKILNKEIKILNRKFSEKPSSKVHIDDKIEMILKKTSHEDEYWNGSLLKLEENPEIIHEDNNLIIISKPPFMSTHPAGKHLFYCATVYMEKENETNLHSIHRLDRETSGILLLAKNTKTAIDCSEQFEKGEVKKCYFFIAKLNSPYKDDNKFKVDNRLESPYTDEKRVIVESYPSTSKIGKSALTHFEIINIHKNYVLGLAFPQTGRQHQIRVHALVKGIPLLGDKIYLGGYPTFQRFKDNVSTDEDIRLMEIPRHALHAIAIQLNYLGKKQEFITSIPNDLEKWIRKNTTINLSKLNQDILDLVENYFKKY